MIKKKKIREEGTEIGIWFATNFGEKGEVRIKSWREIGNLDAEISSEVLDQLDQRSPQKKSVGDQGVHEWMPLVVIVVVVVVSNLVFAHFRCMKNKIEKC